MPPKNKNEPSKKTVEKQKQKVIEDKTFGIKNKKGAKQQKFVQQVQKQVTLGNKSAREVELSKQEKDQKKELKKKQAEELNALFKPVTELQKVAHGVDPKSVLCQYYKQGKCMKGDKCKFSHDLTLARKTEKRSLYSGDDPAEKQESMEGWSQQELEDVVNKKHAESERSLPPTTIICKYFLEAVGNSKYGWFWNCPNGEKCHYRHALPPGFVLKRDKKKMEEQKEQISLEELIETERSALSAKAGQTPVTYETFLAWKRRKRAEKLSKAKEAKAKRQAEAAAGRSVGISGREMFEFRPELQMDEGDDEAGGEAWDFRQREADEEDDSVQVREIRFDEFDEAYGADDGGGGGGEEANGEQLIGAVGGVAAAEAAGGSQQQQLVIDEALFAAEDVDDELDNIDRELDTLQLDE